MGLVWPEWLCSCSGESALWVLGHVIRPLFDLWISWWPHLRCDICGLDKCLETDGVFRHNWHRLLLPFFGSLYTTENDLGMSHLTHIILLYPRTSILWKNYWYINDSKYIFYNFPSFLKLLFYCVLYNELLY